MSISCACDFDEDEDSYYINDIDFYVSDSVHKCAACGEKIVKGRYLWKAPTYKHDEDGEECDFGEIIHCEKCGDLAAILWNLGFCFNWHSDMAEQWNEYQAENF